MLTIVSEYGLFQQPFLNEIICNFNCLCEEESAGNVTFEILGNHLIPLLFVVSVKIGLLYFMVDNTNVNLAPTVFRVIAELESTEGKVGVSYSNNFLLK